MTRGLPGLLVLAGGLLLVAGLIGPHIWKVGNGYSAAWVAARCSAWVWSDKVIPASLEACRQGEVITAGGRILSGLGALGGGVALWWWGRRHGNKSW